MNRNKRQLRRVDEVTINPATEDTLQSTLEELVACSTLLHGQTTVATAGTAVKLIATDDITRSVTIKAKVGNAGAIYVGRSGVTNANGFILSQGDSLSMDLNNASNNIYIDSSNNGDGVSWYAIV